MVLHARLEMEYWMDQRRKFLIAKLIQTNHLNSLERKELNPPAVTLDEVEAHIIEELNFYGIYPHSAFIWLEGKVVDERCIIVKKEGRFILCVQMLLFKDFDLNDLMKNQLNTV